MTVAGVDGCPGGWLAVTRGPCGDEAALLPDVPALLAHVAGCVVVGIDMPIGLEATGSGRAADRAARARLIACAPPGVAGAGSRVFPAPSRAHLALLPLGPAAANARLPPGVRFTRQAFNISDRIAALDMSLPPGGPVHEVHPELSFLAMTGQTLPRKKSPEGRAARIAALRHAGFDPAALAAGLGPRSGRWAEDDLLDACAAAWSAGRIRDGRHGTVPDPPGRDARGQRMAIHF